eukprot:47329-Chlamydomonas_euryale.AAC.4
MRACLGSPAAAEQVRELQVRAEAPPRVPEHVAAARGWITRWRTRQVDTLSREVQALRAQAAAAATAAAAARESAPGPTGVPQHIASARGWITAWRARRAAALSREVQALRAEGTRAAAVEAALAEATTELTELRRHAQAATSGAEQLQREVCAVLSTR